MAEKTIWTVIIRTKKYQELSTVSFNELENAVEYVEAEIDDAENRDELGMSDDEIRDTLYDELYLDAGNNEYFIEESRLF